MLPAPGTVQGFSYSLSSSSRFDHCIYTGYEVKSDFDPMIGKMIAVGLNRQVALDKMNYNLNNLIIDGMLTNLDLLKLIVKNIDFMRGHYTTMFIETIKEEIKNLSYNSEKKSSILPAFASTLCQKIFNERTSL